MAYKFERLEVWQLALEYSELKASAVREEQGQYEYDHETPF
ncbi:MAG: hypothetical protein ACE5OS_14625 [Anaerolineae bacterium]